MLVAFHVGRTVFEQCPGFDAERKVNVYERGDYHTFSYLLALDTVKEIEIVPGFRVLFRVFIPAVLAVIVWIDTRHPPDGIVEYIVQVAGLFHIVIAIGPGAHLQPGEELGRELGAERVFLESGILHHSGIVHVAQCHTVARLVGGSGC